MYKIPFSKPHLTPGDIKMVSDCLKSTWISSKSPQVERFERMFAEKVSQTRYAIAVNSATSGLFLALKALGIKEGDEVILPTFTMIATMNAVLLAGAKPVLADCKDSSDWNISPDGVLKKISKKTKAVIPVHIYGFVCEMDKINDLAKRERIFVLEDAAEAMGSEYKGRRAGNFGDLACFSLYANKIITTGNGGMVTTNDRKLYEILTKIRFFGFGEERHFQHKIVGYNMALTGLQASLGISQLKRFRKYVAKRKLIHQWWKTYLKPTGLKVVEAPPNQNPNYWFPAVLFPSSNLKNKIANLLEKNGVETRNFFMPLHRQPVFTKMFKKEKLPISESFFEKGLLLPSYYELSEKDVNWASGVVMKAIK